MSPPNLLVSVVVPAYNEIENLPELYRQLTGEFEKLDEALELLFLDDGSVGGTLDWLRATSQRDQRIQYISFSRNFGQKMRYATPCSISAPHTMEIQTSL